MYSDMLPRDENLVVMTALTEFFATKLIKKGMRQSDPFADDDLRACIEEFRAVVSIIVYNNVVVAKEWEKACGDFSNKWIGYSHWVCPVRLAEYVEGLGVTYEWDGVLDERRKVPPKDFIKKKEKRERAPVEQRTYHCPTCNIHCNSAAQLKIHQQGSRHTDSISSAASSNRSSYDCSSDDEPATPPAETEISTQDLKVLLSDLQSTLAFLS